MDHKLLNKYDQLKDIILSSDCVIVAFSGGVDSSLLFKVCVDVLGDKAIAVTASSDTFPARELDDSKKFAQDIGGKHIIIVSEELDIPGFSENPPDRCYLCKNELFTRVKAIADEYGARFVFDGNNADDAGDYRPGRKAARQQGVRSPLEEAGMSKNDVRALSRHLGLDTWDKPAFACLSSRFPYHTKITRPALQQVDKGENYLLGLGMKIFRVRHHDTIARLELGDKEMSLLSNPDIRNKIVTHFKALGYKYVAMDLEGYRTGSMNETLTVDQISIHG